MTPIWPRSPLGSSLMSGKRREGHGFDQDSRRPKSVELWLDGSVAVLITKLEAIMPGGKDMLPVTQSDVRRIFGVTDGA